MERKMKKKKQNLRGNYLMQNDEIKKIKIMKK
jgi:hypothetical protein